MKGSENMKKQDLRTKALDKFNDGIFHSSEADFKTNDLLEEIAGKRYDIYESDDDPIYTILGTLTNSKLRRFIKGVDEIIKQ